MAHCSVASCKNNYRNTKGQNIIYHVFPKDERRKEWIDKCNRPNGLSAKYSYICSEHFAEDAYKRDLQAELLGLPCTRKLKSTAVPSLKLTNPNIDIYSSRHTSEKNEEMLECYSKNRKKRAGTVAKPTNRRTRIFSVKRKKKDVEISMPEKTVESNDYEHHFRKPAILKTCNISPKKRNVDKETPTQEKLVAIDDHELGLPSSKKLKSTNVPSSKLTNHNSSILAPCNFKENEEIQECTVNRNERHETSTVQLPVLIINNVLPIQKNVDEKISLQEQLTTSHKHVVKLQKEIGLLKFHNRILQNQVLKLKTMNKKLKQKKRNEEKFRAGKCDKCYHKIIFQN